MLLVSPGIRGEGILPEFPFLFGGGGLTDCLSWKSKLFYYYNPGETVLKF
jgi:hypothetical protein